LGLRGRDWSGEREGGKCFQVDGVIISTTVTAVIEIVIILWSGVLSTLYIDLQRSSMRICFYMRLDGRTLDDDEQSSRDGKSFFRGAALCGGKSATLRPGWDACDSCSSTAPPTLMYLLYYEQAAIASPPIRFF
jgi:hypothetical protein